MNKTETLNNITDTNSFERVIIDLCKQSGLQDVKRISEYVIGAKEKLALKTIEHKFILTFSELSGKISQIVDLINKFTDNDDEITIITLNKKRISNYFKEWIIKQTKTNKIDFWNQNDLIKSIDEYLPHYWGHNDLFLKSYEDYFINDIQQEVELKKVLKLDNKFESLLNIFIEPKIYIFREDKETNQITRVRISIDKFLKKEDNFFLAGDAGTGKSTLLKQIGKLVLEDNINNDISILPIFIKTIDIQEKGFSISQAIETILINKFGVEDLEKIYSEYHLLLLIDSIDEFEKDIRENVLKDLNEIIKETNSNFILATRNYESITENIEIVNHYHAFISNFDQKQVKKYLDNFFKFDLLKANKLWENLIDNNILDRIPVTPLTISLISILYEEKQYEVPATLTDVYDNFNQFLLGRTTVKSRLEFLDINIKERIISIYALQIIREKNRKRKNKNEFIEFIKDFFSKKSITINDEVVPELIKSLTDGTGILYIDDKGLVTFKHDHFMEYYASREIFIQHNRTILEDELIDRFTEYNWQNTAIFYTGRTKDMPEFLEKLLKRIDKYYVLNDYLLAISGLGYILQSLWMTDSVLRKDGVLKSLDLLLKADNKVKQLASEKFHFFNGIKDIDIAFMNLVWFYNHFNSIAIKDPLNLAFETIYAELSEISGTVFEHEKVSRLYKLFCIASTLDTGRNADSSKLNILFDEQGILNNPFFVILFEEGSKILELANEKTIKEQRKIRNKIKKYISAIRFYLDTPSDELRFTTYDKLMPLKKVKIITEGKTDAEIISHSFNILTDYKEPYWNILSLDKIKKNAGGANEVRKYLEEISKQIKDDTFDSTKVIIGLFDNDAKGNQEFGGLSKDFNLINRRIKKHKEKNIYALKLPIPDYEEYNPYRQEKQEFKFFSIEHYFPIDYLKKHNMVSETPIPGAFEITGKKSEFSKNIFYEKDEVLFKNFISLFHEIDRINDHYINYIE